jgi:hypothetical protein
MPALQAETPEFKTPPHQKKKKKKKSVEVELGMRGA